MLRNLFCLLLAIVCSVSANAETYKYCMYDVEIGVGRTGAMRVNEMTNVEFSLPRHGIVRDLPTQSYVRRLLPDGHGGVVERLMCYDTDYSDIYVSDKFNISEHDHMLSLRIGDKDQLITGEKKYELSYVHHLKDDRTPCGDIFYYSLLGAYHEAETDTFRFCIRFDEPVPQSSLDSLRLFYGKLGSDRVHNEALTVVTDSMICGEITGLNPHEAVTVFMPLPEGYFNSSDVGMGIAWWMILFVTTILMCIAVIVREMRQHNRFIKVIECWPPKGRSSADLGYIYDTTVDSQDIISLIPYFAHRGLLDIDTTTGHPILHKKKEISAESPLYQRLLFDAMFAKSDTFDTKKPTKHFAKTWLKLEAEIKNANKGMADEYSPWLLLWLAAGVTCFLGFCAADITKCDMVLLYGLGITCLFLPIGILSLFLWDRKFMSQFRAILLVILYLICMCVQYVLWYSMNNDIEVHLTPLMQSTMLITYPFALIASVMLFRLRSISKTRLTMIGQILGFKEFIEKSEKPMLDSLSAEHENYFFDILPYAIAFGLSDKWISKFAPMLDSMPDWYKSNDNSPKTFAHMMNPHILYSSKMRDSVINEQAAEMAAESKASASRGSIGGFSGGGFGGGGSHSW